MDQNKITIQLQKGQEQRLKHYAEKYGMKVKQARGSRDLWEVSGWQDVMDIYWLGANMAMPPFETGISKHI